jgi:hypothetical protein
LSACLKKSRPVWNHNNNEAESFEYGAFFTSVVSTSVVSPTIVANEELETSKGLHLNKIMINRANFLMGKRKRKFVD